MLVFALFWLVLFCVSRAAAWQGAGGICWDNLFPHLELYFQRATGGATGNGGGGGGGNGGGGNGGNGGNGNVRSRPRPFNVLDVAFLKKKLHMDAEGKSSAAPLPPPPTDTHMH